MYTEHHRNNHMVMETCTYAHLHIHHSTATLLVSEIDGDDFVGQSFQFLSAGFETSGSSMTLALYELALHSEIQNRLRADIMQVLNKHKGQVT
jgi:cytochrome P450